MLSTLAQPGLFAAREFLICGRMHFDPAPCPPLDQVPIVAPIVIKKLETLEKEPLPTRFTNEFLTTLMANPGAGFVVVIGGRGTVTQ